ncbi:MAG: flippase [Proteobacteria bacterium]|nr:flippase [Pseudomonadota bacterium]
MPQPHPAPPATRRWTRFLPGFARDRLAGREGLQHIVGNVGWHSADHLLRGGVGLLIGIWVARCLGPEQFGLLSYALAFVALFSPLATLGLDDIVVRNLVRAPARRDETLGTSFFLKLGGGLASVVAALAVIAVVRPTDPESHWLVAILAAGTLFQAVNAIELWFNAQVLAKFPVLAKSAAFLVCAAGKVALILGGAPLVAFAWVSLVETVLGAAGLLIAYRLQGHRIGAWVGRIRVAAELLKDSWPLLFSCAVIVIYLRIDQVMLGDIAGSQAVGVYTVAVRLAEVWFFFSSAVYWSVLPSLVEAKAVSEALFYARLQKYYNLMALAAYAVAIPVMLLARWLVPTLFGEPYAGAGPMLAVLIWANLFIYLDSARSAFFNVMNWYRVYLVTLALGAALNVLLNLLWIPRYGGMGAVVASCVSYWFAAHGTCFLYKPLRRTGLMLTRAIFCPRVW